MPRFRQKITSMGAIALNNPVWADDPRFDIERHVRRVALPRPGGAPAAARAGRAGDVRAARPDRGRCGSSTWSRGSRASATPYISKTHHALVDGVVGGRRRHDPARRRTRRAPRWRSPERALGARRAEPRAAVRPRRLRAHPRAAARGAARRRRGALTMPRETAGRVMRTAEGFAELAASGPTAPRDLPQPGDRPRPRVAFVDHELDGAEGDARRRRRDRQRRHPRRSPPAACGASSSGAATRCPGASGRPRPDEHPPPRRAARARQPDRHAAGPAADRRAPIPRRGWPLIHAETTRAEGVRAGHAASLIIEATGWTPPTINRVLAGGDLAAARLQPGRLQRPRAADARSTCSAAGCSRDLPVRAAVAAGPRALDRGVSYDGGVFFGLAGDRDLLADIDEFAADLRAALDEQSAS